MVRQSGWVQRSPTTGAVREKARLETSFRLELLRTTAARSSPVGEPLGHHEPDVAPGDDLPDLMAKIEPGLVQLDEQLRDAVERGAPEVQTGERPAEHR